MKSKTAYRRANAADLLLKFNIANGQTNADLDGLSGEEAHKRRVMAESIREAEEDRIKAEAQQKRHDEVALGIAPIMDAVRAADQQHDFMLGKRWRHSLADIQSMIDITPESYYFRLHELPLIPADESAKVSFEDFRNAFHAFLAKKEKEGVTLDDESKEKLAIFICAQAKQFEGKPVGISPLATETFENCLDNLIRWNAVNVTRKAKPQVAPELKITDYTDAATDKEVVERDLAHVVLDDNGLCNQWLASLAENFGFFPDEQQWKNAIALMEHRLLPLTDPASYDTTRVALVHAKVWPEKSPSGKHLLTKDERVADLTEKYSLSDPAQRREFFQKRNEILFQD